MEKRRRPPTGLVAAQAAEMTFPVSLLQPPQSQVTQYSDAVADRIARLDLEAQRLGDGFGVSLTNFVLNPRGVPAASDSIAAMTHVLESFIYREERVSLERRSGRWGLYFTRTAALLDREKVGETIPLRDAALDVRERFLARSEVFFRHYLSTCEGRLGQMKSSVTTADTTLNLLANLQLR